MNPRVWGQSFEFLIRDPHGVDVFKNYLKSQYCDENIDFWLAVEKFRNLEDDELDRQANIILKTFVARNAARAVNLKAPAREQVIKAAGKEITRSVFDEAQREIYEFMMRDPYVRFLQSEAYAEACK